MHSERVAITQRRINCIPPADTVYDGTLPQRRLARLDHQLTLLEQALIRVDGMDERIEFVTTKMTAIVIRRISGTRKRHEEKRLIFGFIRSLSRKRRARIARLGAQFDGSRRVLIGKLTQWG